MTFVEIITEKFSPALLEQVVVEQALLDAAARAALFTVLGFPPGGLAEKTVGAYGVRTARLAWGLYEKLSDSDWQTASLLEPHLDIVDIIVGRIEPAILERVVFDHGLLDESLRNALFKASGLSYREIVEKTIGAYGAQKARLAWAIYEQVYDAEWSTAKLLALHFPRDVSYHNHQASLVGRIPTLPLLELNAFLETVKAQVCLVVARKGNDVARGTGFLVAPDLILTCRHVLKQFQPGDDVVKNGSRIEVYFDFFYGEPVNDVGLTLPGAQKVGLAAEWHIASADLIDPDGVIGALSDEVLARMLTALDFVLLRLDKKVGLQPINRSGGRRRKWIQFAPNAVPQGLQPEHWIIIPQHPNGFPLKIDLGRYREIDPSETRIRYNTNTAPGTSGAPCFNHQFQLVGLHNASVGPEAKRLANQAIRFDHIAALIADHVDEAANVKDYYKRWSTSRVGEPPRVILGREVLLDWISGSLQAAPLRLADRVYVAKANVPGAGSTFSSDVLHAEIRDDKKIRRSVYGTAGQQLPATAKDFLTSLLRELGIKEAQMASMPPQPGAPAAHVESPSLPGEVDKLERWISDELPTWLGDIISAHVEKKVDRRIAARQALELYRQQEMEVPPDMERDAAAAEPIYVRTADAWNFAYVVIDELRVADYQGKGSATKITTEVGSLLAALVKGKPETAMHPGLRRLRWMFLGYLPDFVGVAQAGSDGATVEELDPAAVSVKEILAVIGRMSDAHLQLQEGSNGPATRAMAKVFAQQPSAPENRLPGLQQAVSAYSAALLEEITV